MEYDELMSALSDDRISDFLVAMELSELDLPHIVLTRGDDFGVVTYSGPYLHAVDALTAAEAQHRIQVNSGGGDLTFHVAALYPDDDLTDTD
ncbi:hypothetical protein SAMN04489867_3056 [Pedococcus dokdonensis]|uniref:Uncharacterized protein n=1 Tax=Pedococcus dokdonensis TaxID=443156 RepID=A0A1H0TZS8_9MICO|nr:hypothetical protein [Pedococcus dokdonensis]SDP59411.1 hypothetical protein SAMN04489867_3056 [Pedococcus dokdonensis]